MVSESRIWEQLGIISKSRNSYLYAFFESIRKEFGDLSLFDTDSNGRLLSCEKILPKSQKTIQLLKRSVEMENQIISETEKVLSSPEYDGLLYFVYALIEGKPSLMYVGICHRKGRDREINANLNLKNREFFVRWGDDSARHTGGLSNAIFENGYKIEQKYWRFAQALFNIQKIQTNLGPKTLIKEKNPLFFSMIAIKQNCLIGEHQYSLDELESAFIQDFNPEVNTYF